LTELVNHTINDILELHHNHALLFINTPHRTTRKRGKPQT
jgi:hypothetical protein